MRLRFNGADLKSARRFGIWTRYAFHGGAVVWVRS